MLAAASLPNKRLKKDIKPLGSSLDGVLELQEGGLPLENRTISGLGI
jgi:hypothetical protein